MNDYALFFLVIIVFILITLLILEKRKTKKTFNRLTIMLDKLKTNSFFEKIFDETILSYLEAEFFQYLLSSQGINIKMKKEKNSVKQLVSDISHQTKTPLSNILLYLELLKEVDLPEEGREYLELINIQSHKLEFLLKALVDLSRLEAGIISPQPLLSNIDDLIDNSVTIAKPLGKIKNINIEIEKYAGKAMFDIKWTSEALFNILDNAIKYSEKNTTIFINVIEHEFFTSINVYDQGIGIKKEETSKIFSRFYRSASVSEDLGVGVGLFLAREIITLQDGYIKVTRNYPKGSIFSIFLPK